MTTVVTTIDNTAYVKVNDTAVTDAILQNTSAYMARISFAATIPAAGATNYHSLREGASFEVVGGVPAGSAWVRAENANRDVVIAVSA